MNPSNAVVASVLIITSTTIVRRIKEKKDYPQGYIVETIIFGFLLLVALLTLAIVMPQVAKVFAYLGIVGAFVVNGEVIFSALGDFGRTNGRGSTGGVNVASMSGARSLAGSAR